MSDISTNPTSIIAGPSQTSVEAQTTSDAADNLISSDFETFLNMLTAQLQNQDPLNPLESTDFAVQLATFSGVEQQVLTNGRLQALTGQLTASSLSSLSNWIGNEVLTDLDVTFDGQPIDIVASPEPGATRAELVIRDSSDTVVDVVEVNVRGGAVRWTGDTAAGRVPEGTYRISTVSFDPSNNILADSSTPAYHSVVEVLPNNGDPVLALLGGQVVSAEKVQAVRKPLAR